MCLVVRMKKLIDRLERNHVLTHSEFAALIDGQSQETEADLFARARAIRQREYGTDVYIRGLIEFTNYCKNDCYYCGIRKSNTNAQRYRLSKEDILCCCDQGYELGFRTFVLQGGEDGWFTDERLCDVISEIRNSFPDCAITLSVGERSRQSYQRLYEAGANR